MKIAGFCQDSGACTNIRITQPLRKIKKLGLADVALIEAGDGDTIDKCRQADVVVLGRAFSDNVVRIVGDIHSWGGKVVFDLDDNFFDVSPFSPHYKQLGIMPVNLDREDGQSAPMWVDGVNGFDLSRSRKIRKDFIRTIRAVDCITVTTEPLAREYRRFNDNVRVVPNAVDFSIWEKPPIRWEKDEVRLLYTGAANHQEDFFFVKDVLRELQDKYPRLRIVFIGTDWKTISNNLDYSRVESHSWVHIEAYPYLLKGLCCDIGIAPISKTKFNDCRSALKWKEYSALKMATVATRHGPYARAIQDGVTGVLVDEREDWYYALAKLIENDVQRRAIAHNAYRVVKQKYNLDFIVDTWVDVFRGA